ncbi:MAG: DUF2505 family protein [Kofleriaceae bacterium]
MPTDFRFEQEFRADAARTILAAYYDADQLAAQDALGQLVDREVVESRDDGDTWVCTWRVSSAKPLPALARPMVAGGRLTYLETMTWRRADDAADIAVVPQLLGGRVQFAGRYQFAAAAPGRWRRTYAGTISAAIPMLGGKIERGVLAEFESSVPKMAACTQAWLDARAAGGAS